MEAHDLLLLGAGPRVFFDQVKLLVFIEEHKDHLFVFVAPPCGTASLARTIPLPQYLLEDGAHEPQPLRTAPLGWHLLTDLGWVLALSDGVGVHSLSAPLPWVAPIDGPRSGADRARCRCPQPLRTAPLGGTH